MAKAKAADAVSEQQVEKKAEAPKRVYQNQYEFDTDLFRLKTQKTKKNTHWNKETPDWRSVDHEHFFHTYDSNGKKMTESNSVGGHFHIMEVKQSGDGPPVVKCSAPKKYIHKKGRKVMVDASEIQDPDDAGYDQHVHVVSYERSSKMTPRVANAEGIKLITEDSKKVAPIPGIA